MSTSNSTPSANLYIQKQSTELESTEKSREQTHQTTDKEGLGVFERNHSSMRSRETRNYRMNENNRNFKVSNDDRNFIINASALAAAGLTSSLRFQRFERFEDSIHRQSRQNNLKEFKNDEMTMDSSTSSSYDRQMTNLTKVYTDEMKYEGLNDNFHYKITIYHDTCRRVEVSNEIKTLNLSTMLKDSALKYHYAQMSRINTDVFFEIMCKRMIN